MSSESEIPSPEKDSMASQELKDHGRSDKTHSRRKGKPPKRVLGALLAASIAVSPIIAKIQEPSSRLGIEQLHRKGEPVISAQSLEALMKWSQQDGALKKPLITTSPANSLPDSLLAKVPAFIEDAPGSFLETAPYIPLPDRNQAIEKAAKLDPTSFIYNAGELKSILPRQDWSRLLEKSFARDPQMINQMIEPKEHLFGYSLLGSIEKPELPSTKILTNLIFLDTSILLDKMASEGLTESEAKKIIDDKDVFYKTLIELKAKTKSKHILGDVSVEHKLDVIAGETISHIDMLHDAPNQEERFATIKKFSAKELYSLLVYRDDGIYTSSFNGVYTRLQEKMHQEGISGKQLLEQTGNNRFRIFIKELATFNRLNDFLGTMKESDASNLLAETVMNIEQTGDKVAQAATIADYFNSISDPQILQLLQEQLKHEYDRIDSMPDSKEKEENKKLYGLLASISTQELPNNDIFFKEITHKYPVPDINKVEASELFNKENVNIQQYFFYDDRSEGGLDGHNSFRHMLNSYGFGVEWDSKGTIKHINDAQVDGWNLTDKGHYVLLSTTKNGKTIKIYANKPTDTKEGQIAIKHALQGAEPSVVTHRGHSYYVNQTIAETPNTAKIIDLGACGGTYYTEKAINQAPNADIIATKGTGTMEVNDVILKALNEQILSGKDIVWAPFWKTLKDKLKGDNDFAEYAAPNKNYGAVFFAAISAKRS